MARPALTDAQKRESRRRIQAAAAQLYREHGLSNLSARSIAKAAGVSVGSLYSHFGSLPELMRSLWTAPVRRLTASLEATAAEHEDPAERLPALLRCYLEFALGNPEVYRGAFLFMRPAGQQPDAVVALEEDRFFSLLRDTLSEGIDTGRFAACDPDQTAQLLWSALHGSLALPENIDRIAFRPAGELAEPLIAMLESWVRG